MLNKKLKELRTRPGCSCSKVDNIIHWINHYPVDTCWQNNLVYARAVFTWVSKVNCVCFGFALLRLVIGLKLSGLFLSQSEVKPKRFPALCAGYMNLLWVLIGSLNCLCFLWLARVITLVLVLVFQHSIENCSIHRIVIYLALRLFTGWIMLSTR